MSDIEYMILAATKATSLATTIYVSGMGIELAHVKVQNILPNYKLSDTGSKKLPSFQARTTKLALHTPRLSFLSFSSERAINCTVRAWNGTLIPVATQDIRLTPPTRNARRASNEEDNSLSLPGCRIRGL